MTGLDESADEVASEVDQGFRQGADDENMAQNIISAWIYLEKRKGSDTVNLLAVSGLEQILQRKPKRNLAGH